MNVLSYATYDSLAHCTAQCQCDNWLNNYLLTYQLPEDMVVNPSNNLQYIAASAKNRYLRSVTINAVNNQLSVTPSSSIQTFTDGPYSTVTVAATQS